MRKDIMAVTIAIQYRELNLDQRASSRFPIEPEGFMIFCRFVGSAALYL
jgi:hypothetical protein